MKEYEIEVKLSFTGCVTVNADSKIEALQIVRDNFCAMLGQCGDNGCDAIVDWDIDPHNSAIVAK